MMLYTGDQASIPHDDMIDCMADLTDEEVLRDFTPPEGGAPIHDERSARRDAAGRIFAR